LDGFRVTGEGNTGRVKKWYDSRTYNRNGSKDTAWIKVIYAFETDASRRRGKGGVCFQKTDEPLSLISGYIIPRSQNAFIHLSNGRVVVCKECKYAVIANETI